MDIWAACREAVEPISLDGEVIRVVESQEQVATNALVDHLDEQSQLEEMLEQSKPPVPPASTGLHYLLATPFRYPPLKHGSRFGARLEPSIFYGSIDPGAALAEAAYYRFVFWSGMVSPPPGSKLTTEHTLFGAAFRTERGIRLHEAPFTPYQVRLRNPSDYRDTQMLGQNMRVSGIEVFEYISARDPAGGVNTGLFHAGVFVQPAPLWQQTWLCDTRAHEVSLYSKERGAWTFPLTDFLVDGALPVPAL